MRVAFLFLAWVMSAQTLVGPRTYKGAQDFTGSLVSGTAPFAVYGISDTVNPSYSGNIFLGPLNGAGTAPVTGNSSNFAAAQNVAIGDKSMLAVTTGIHNVALGAGDAQSITTASHVIAVGHANANVLLTGDYNIFLGFSAALSATSLGVENIFIGDSVAANTTGGSGIANNIGIGSRVFDQLTSGSNNVGLGVSACSSITSGIANTCIGYQSNVSAGTANFSIAIGYAASAASGSVVIGQQISNAAENTVSIGANAKTFYHAGSADIFTDLPACSSAYEGSQRPVADSTTGTWAATITGGGGIRVLAYCNGTNWTVAAR